MKKQKGFTLIEIIMYVIIVGIVAITFVTFTIDVTTSAQKSRIRQEIQQQARYAIQRISQSIREADDINTGSSTFDTHPGVLSLATESASTNPTVFDINNGQLRITEGVTTPEALTSDRFDVTNFVIEDKSVNNRTKNIKYTITIEHPNPDNNEIFNVSITLQGSAVIKERID